MLSLLVGRREFQVESIEVTRGSDVRIVLTGKNAARYIVNVYERGGFDVRSLRNGLSNTANIRGLTVNQLRDIINAS